MQNNKIYLSFDLSGNFLCSQEDNVKIYAGSVASVEYIVKFSKNLGPNDYVYISFTRADNKKTSPLLCERVLDNTFRHLSTGEELDIELETAETMIANVSIKSRDIVTNISAIKTQASVELPVYPGSQFTPGVAEEGIVHNFEEHLIGVERDTIKKYNINELDELVIPFDSDGYKQAPAFYVGYEHEVNYINHEDASTKSRIVKGSLLVVSETADDNIIQSEYLFVNNNIFARTLKLNESHDVVAPAEFNDITGGADGKSVFIKFAEDAYGTNAQNEWHLGLDYMGLYIGYNEPSGFGSYKWARFVGEQGPRGEIGRPGVQGIRGEKGEEGKGVASVSFVKILDNGDWQYSINLTDGSNYPIIIPKGEKGERGVDGNTGATGAKGEKGDPGINGNDFTIKGRVSSTGALPALTAKDVGTAYLVGTMPPRRVWLWGYNEDGELDWLDEGYLQGPKGETGETGATGATGAKGDDGVNGTGIASIEPSGTDIAGNNIYTISLTDGRSYNIVIPKGTDGAAGTVVKVDGKIVAEFNADEKADKTDIVNLEQAKADKAAVEALNSAKANKAEVEALDAAKASKADVDALQSTKADKAELPIGLPIGSIIMGAIPLNDASVHLLDGGTISQTGIYSDFCTYLKSLAQTNPNIVCTEAQFNSDVSSTGNCGKFVIDNTAGTIRLPKITRFIQGLTSITNIGTSVTAGLPNITGNIGNSSAENRIMGGSTVNQNIPTGGAFTSTLHSGIGGFGNGNGYAIKYILNFDAHSSNTIYGNSNTVQPEATQYPYYIVLANSVVTQVLVDINNIISELNNKVSNNSGANISVGDILSNGHATLYVEDSGENHIRRSDGWQICMGRMNASANSRTTFTLPMPFKDKYAYNVIAQDGGHENSGQWGVLQKVIPISSTQFTLFNAGDATYLFTYIAIGRWK